MPGLTRKELLAGAAAAGVVAGCGGGSPKKVGPRGWGAVKAQFALSSDVRHFDAFVLATHPKSVRAAIDTHRRGLDADPNEYLRAHEAELDERVLDAAGRYLGVPGDFALTDSTTMGLGLVYGTLRAEGEAVATEHDFYATHEALRLRFGKVRKIRLYDDPATATEDGIVEAVKAGIDADTGILALTWVHSSTGVRLPIRAIAERVGGERRHGMLMVVDGVHALGAVDEPVGIEAFDVLVAGTHKWIGGPRGTGIVWSIKAWERMRPVIPSFASEPYLGWLEDRPVRPVDYSGATLTPGGYHSFEHRWALAEAFDFHADLGRAKVAERIRTLATRLKEGLAELPKVQLITPMSPSLSAGIVCFDVAGLRAGEVVERLRGEHRIGASVTPYKTEHVRLGTGLWVDEADVDAAIRAVSKL